MSKVGKLVVLILGLSSCGPNKEINTPDRLFPPSFSNEDQLSLHFEKVGCGVLWLPEEILEGLFAKSVGVTCPIDKYRALHMQYVDYGDMTNRNPDIDFMWKSGWHDGDLE